jgi:hypothetical protein
MSIVTIDKPLANVVYRLRDDEALLAGSSLCRCDAMRWDSVKGNVEFVVPGGLDTDWPDFVFTRLRALNAQGVSFGLMLGEEAERMVYAMFASVDEREAVMSSISAAYDIARSLLKKEGARGEA